MNKKTSKVRFLALSAVIAALYAVLTYAAAAMNLAFGAVQFRFSEALTVLPAFSFLRRPSPLAVGLPHRTCKSAWRRRLGVRHACNAACGHFFLPCTQHSLERDPGFEAPLSPVIFNALIVGFEVACLADNGTFAFGNLSLAGFIAGAVSVGIGELIVCYVLGVPLMMALRRTKISELMLA